MSNPKIKKNLRNWVVRKGGFRFIVFGSLGVANQPINQGLPMGGWHDGNPVRLHYWCRSAQGISVPPCVRCILHVLLILHVLKTLQVHAMLDILHKHLCMVDVHPTNPDSWSMSHSESTSLSFSSGRKTSRSSQNSCKIDMIGNRVALNPLVNHYIVSPIDGHAGCKSWISHPYFQYCWLLAIKCQNVTLNPLWNDWFLVFQVRLSRLKKRSLGTP